jgi:outer membrane murein-binding lipoprotein Lpp
MLKTALLIVLSVASVSTLAGCESHQAKVDRLQKEYDALEAQFRKDCSDTYLQAQPTLSPKCKEEDQKTKDAWARLQAERTGK